MHIRYSRADMDLNNADTSWRVYVFCISLGGGLACLALSIIHQFQGIVLEICPNTTHNGDPLLLALDKTIGPQKCMYVVLPIYLSVFTEYVPMYCMYVYVTTSNYIYFFHRVCFAILIRLLKTN